MYNYQTMLLHYPLGKHTKSYGKSPLLIGKSTINGGKHTKNYGKSPLLLGKSTISMAIFQPLQLGKRGAPPARDVSAQPSSQLNAAAATFVGPRWLVFTVAIR